MLLINASLYEEYMENNAYAHKIVKSCFEENRNLFPKSMSEGYCLNGKTRVSKKTKLQMRKIKTGNETYQLRPSFVLSYQKGNVDEASKGLFLIKFGVPFWALAEVFGHSTMWWYRLYLSLGTTDIVGTSIYQASNLPRDIIADEHHIRVRGKKKYVATTVGSNCFLGMAVCESASEASLEEGYAVFKTEPKASAPNYEPDSVNTDGWAATKKAWKKLYPSIVLIECFLHAFLKVRDRSTKKLMSFFCNAGDKIWNCYRTNSKRELAQQIRRLKEWTIREVSDCPMKDNIFKFCTKKSRSMKHLDNSKAHRTSNMLDRLMRAMKKHKVNSQMFHSTTQVTTDNFRAFALLYNFTPSCPSVWKEQSNFKSPAERLNQKSYANNWLENLLISAEICKSRYHSKLL
jgi:hypothetical protein